MTINKDSFIEIYKTLNNKTIGEKDSILAEHFKCSTRTIRNYRSKFGLTVQNTLNLDKKLLKEQLATDKTIIDIAKYFNCSTDSIYSYMNKYNLSRTDRINIAKLKYLYEKENYNITQLMNYFNTSDRKVIISRLEKYNIRNDLKDKITDLYKNYYSSEQIALELNIPIEKVEYNLQHHSIYREKKLDISTIDLKTLRNSGATLQTIANHFNCSERTISDILNKNNLLLDTKKQFIFDIETIAKLYKEHTLDEIASIYGCCRKTVQNFTSENSIESSNINKLELKIETWLKVNNIPYIKNSRKIISPLELDFYLPSHNIAIEICGLYWHSTKIRKDIKHILNKYNTCKQNGIQLITIFEDEILENKDIVYNRLSSILKLSKSLCGARNCKIREISSREGIDFLNKYHIQKAGKNSWYIGAYYNNELVSVMSFSKGNPAKGQDKSYIELNRFVNPFNVIGIASRLFKFYVKTYSPDTIISYSDKRWNTGEIYKVLGFTQLKDSQPNYWYVYRQTRKHRWNFTKQKLMKMLQITDDKYTEEEMAKILNLYRIYDCGHMRFVWKNQ